MNKTSRKGQAVQGMAKADELIEDFLHFYDTDFPHYIKESYDELKNQLIKLGFQKTEAEVIIVFCHFVNQVNATVVEQWCNSCSSDISSFCLSTDGRVSMENGTNKINTFQEYGVNNVYYVYSYMHKKFNLKRNIFRFICMIMISPISIFEFMFLSLGTLVNSNIANHLKIVVSGNKIDVDLDKKRSNLVIEVFGDKDGEMENVIRKLIRN